MPKNRRKSSKITFWRQNSTFQLKNAQISRFRQIRAKTSNPGQIHASELILGPQILTRTPKMAPPNPGQTTTFGPQIPARSSESGPPRSSGVPPNPDPRAHFGTPKSWPDHHFWDPQILTLTQIRTPKSRGLTLLDQTSGSLATTYLISAG